MSEHLDDEVLARLANVNPVKASDVTSSGQSASALLLFDSILAGPAPRRSIRRLLRRCLRRDVATIPSSSDPLLELLRLANPVAQPDVAGSVEHLRVETLRDRILEVGRLAPKSIRPPATHRRKVAIIGVGSVALIASAAGYVIASRPVTNFDYANCFKSASLSAKRAEIVPGAERATNACLQQVWRTGTFGTPSSPTLIGCVLPDGVEDVFPGHSDSLCSKLGLSVALKPTEEAVRASALQAAFATTTGDPPLCLDVAQAQSVAKRLLRKEGLAGWSVRILSPPTTARPCVTAGVDPTKQTVFLSALPRFATPTGPSGVHQAPSSSSNSA